MKKFITLALLLASALTSNAFQRDSIPSKTSLDWGVSLSYVFDNSEYYASSEAYDLSGTVHGVRLSPSVGVAIPQGDKVLHRVRVGMDLLKMAGENLPVRDVFDEFQLYYDVRADLCNGGCFEALAGCFPRTYFGGSYVGPVFDRSVYFLDSNVDGMLFKYSNERIRAELGLDWLGMFADADHPDRRERFQILTSGDWAFAGPFHLLWTGHFYHFACSMLADNVVDNHQITPMLEWRPNCWADLLSLSAGAVVTYQWDRNYVPKSITPAGFYSVQEVEKWHVRLSNRLYCGRDLQPYYGTYGPELYPGAAMFRTRTDRFSLSDEAVLSFCPHITDWLDLGVFAIFNFGSPDSALGTKAYRGCRQYVSLKINLERFNLGL